MYDIRIMHPATTDGISGATKPTLPAAETEAQRASRYSLGLTVTIYNTKTGHPVSSYLAGKLTYQACAHHCGELVRAGSLEAWQSHFDRCPKSCGQRYCREGAGVRP